MRSSPLSRFCKQKPLKYDLVSTVSAYSKSERKKDTQIDNFNNNNITGWRIEDKCTYVVKYGYLKRITALFRHYTDNVTWH